MTVFNWLSLFGVPAIISGVLGYALSQIKAQKNKNEALALGLQALLRDRLLQAFKHHMSEGFIEYSERESWLNMYANYHNLGANGCMDGCKAQLEKLPIDVERGNTHE